MLLEARINEAHDRAGRLEGMIEDVKRTVYKWQNRLNRLFHYFGKAIDAEDEQKTTRKR